MTKPRAQPAHIRAFVDALDRIPFVPPVIPRPAPDAPREKALDEDR